jgi:hypothetical protein
MKVALSKWSVINAFTCGFVYEALSVAWVHAAVHGTPFQTAMMSSMQALALVIGISEAVSDFRVAPLYVFGYGLGSYLAMVYT